MATGGRIMELKGKRAIVTGCARGMGAAIVRAYTAAGAHVVGMDLNDEEGERVVSEARNTGPGRASYRSVDVADKNSVDAAFSAAAAELGGLDVLAHPAAIHRSSSASDVSVDDWDLMFSVNVRGTVLTNQAAFQLMKQSGGGSIINFGSISGQRTEVGAAAYSAAKGAVHAWTRTAAGTWGADHVRVNAVLPAMATPMYVEARERATEEQNTVSYWRNEYPIALGQAYGDPDRDLGPVMVFLASDASHFITGQLIPVDGGQTSVR
jgi:NAD(P)-dependent dehydrogenase (short-subunit alcohol dehydrogenase family)